MTKIITLTGLLFSLVLANAQTNEIWYTETGNHYMVNIKEAKDHGIWVFYANNGGGIDGSVLKKMTRNGEHQLTIDFADGLVVGDIYEYGNGHIFLSFATNDPSIKSPEGAGVFMILDEYGQKIKEHVYLPHPDSTLSNKFSYGAVLNVIAVDETDPETDVIILGYASVGWDDPIHPVSEPFMGTMVGIERIDHLGNRIWTKRLTQFYNWGLPSMIILKDGNMLVTTNGVVFPNSPDSTTDNHDGSVMVKMDLDGNVIWQNNTLVVFNGYYQTTRPEKPIELPNGNLISPIGIGYGLGASIWYTAILTVDKNGITTGYHFVGDTTKLVGKVQLDYLDTNTLIYTSLYHVDQGPGQDLYNANYNVYTIDTMGNTINEWHSTQKIGSTSAIMVPKDKAGFYASPTNWYTAPKTKILKFNKDLTAYTSSIDTFTYNTTQNENLDGLFITLDYYNYLDSIRHIGVENIPTKELTLYPNPAHSQSKIQAPNNFKGGQVVLYTIQGKKLYSATWTPDHNHFNIPVDKLKNGHYMLTLTTKNNEQWVGKLEVSR